MACSSDAVEQLVSSFFTALDLGALSGFKMLKWLVVLGMCNECLEAAFREFPPTSLTERACV